MGFVNLDIPLSSQTRDKMDQLSSTITHYFYDCCTLQVKQNNIIPESYLREMQHLPGHAQTGEP